MSIGGSLSGITFAGLTSGIDTDSIVSRLIQLESIPLQRLQARQQDITQQQSLFGQFRSKLISFSTAAGALNNPGAMNPLSATSSKTEVATVSVSSGGTAGSFNLAVSKLAQAQKLSSVAQTDTTTALGKTGTVIVNGKAVKIEVGDSLLGIAQKINSASAGATASVIDGGSGNAFLTIASNNTGAKNKVQLADFSGTVLSDLGFLTGAEGIREPITNGATSVNLSSATTALGSLTGLSSIANASFTINGSGPISVDLTTGNLQSVANAINAAGAGVTATVRTVSENGTTTYKLDISGASTPTFGDTDGLLKALGIVSRGYGTELVQAQDAEYKLDNVSLTSASNTITTVVPGATITLLKANETTPETTTLTLTRDMSAIKTKVKEFVDAYNGVQDFIREYSALDKETFRTGPLFGDAVARQVESSLSGLLFDTVPGLASPYNNLSGIGFDVDDKGKLSFDESKLTAAISAAPDAVEALFRAKGTTTTSELQYISSTNKTLASGAGAYSVEITQVATKGSYVAEKAQTTASTASETLTFNGGLFANTAYTLTISAGSSLADTVNRINSDSKLKDLVVASIDSGSLKIESKRYGTAGNFTVVSNVTAAADNSGIGVGSLGAKVTGVDVAGTINGEAATGAGQFLTGAESAPSIAGLQVMYTGSTTGSVGSISFTKGIASLATALLGTFTDNVNGLLTASDKERQSRLEQLNLDIADLEKRIQQKQLDLQLKFSRMEQAIANIQSQASRLGALQQSIR